MLVFSSITKWIRKRISNPRAAIQTVLLTVFTAMAMNTFGYMHFDDAKWGDAWWYSVISVTTIGYGDFSATSQEARIITTISIVLIGLPSFGILLGIIGDSVMDRFDKIRRGLAKIMTDRHILIVNFPSTNRVKKTIAEIKGDPSYAGCEVVIVDDKIDALPFDISHVSFIRGSTIERETYEKANIEEVDKIIILSPNAEDSNSDAIVLGAINTIRSMTDVRIVAECLDKQHLEMFSGCKSVSVALTAQISRNVIVQELFDPGVGKLISTIASNLEGTTVFSTIAEGPLFRPEDTPWDADEEWCGDALVFMQRMLSHGVNVLGIVRGDQVITDVEHGIKVGDTIIYVAFSRLSWNAIIGLYNKVKQPT